MHLCISDINVNQQEVSWMNLVAATQVEDLPASFLLQRQVDRSCCLVQFAMRLSPPMRQTFLSRTVSEERKGSSPPLIGGPARDRIILKIYWINCCKITSFSKYFDINTSILFKASSYKNANNKISASTGVSSSRGAPFALEAGSTPASDHPFWF